MANWVRGSAHEEDVWVAEVNGYRLVVWYEKGELEGESSWMLEVTAPDGATETDEADTREGAKAAAIIRTGPFKPVMAWKPRILTCPKCGAEYEDEGTGGLCRSCWNEHTLS